MIAPSRPPLRRAPVLAARPRYSAALVRSFAAAAIVTSTTGCLVLEPPTYEHPEQTAPVLSAVFPPPHLPIHIIPGREGILNLSLTVLSEDNGDPVQTAQYIDYGRRSRFGRPYRRGEVSPGSIAAGTIEGGQRAFTIELDFDSFTLPTDGVTPEKECHTLTLTASHAFTGCRCPADPEDMSSLTWQLIHCDPNDPACPASCPAMDCKATPCLFCDDPSLDDGCVTPPPDD
ncbi:hypothetical protein WME97_12440 [Sorangium sp. So ce367]|uniref:hypothetical protein n=1 Tax=Sorangium sp. So ce367 TaxID=3133305 RepID=UPI003F608229